jgi:hypothetical protein
MDETTSPSTPARGILYIATDEQFVKEATISARSVRESMEGIPIAIVIEGDHAVPSVFDITIQSVDHSDDFGAKVHNVDQTPFEKAMYFHADIYVEKDFSELFDILDHWNLAAVHNNGDYEFGDHERLEDHPLDELPDGVPEHNSGVLAYRSNSRLSRCSRLGRRHTKWIQP